MGLRNFPGKLEPEQKRARLVETGNEDASTAHWTKCQAGTVNDPYSQVRQETGG